MIESDKIQQEETKDKKKENILRELCKDFAYSAGLPQILADAARKRRSNHFRVSEEIKKKEKEEDVLAQFYKDIASGASLPQILEDAAKKEDSTPILVYVEYLPKLESFVQHIHDQKKLLRKRSAFPRDDDHKTISKKLHHDNVDSYLDISSEKNNDDNDADDNSGDGVQEKKQHTKRKSGKPKTSKKSVKYDALDGTQTRHPGKEKLHEMNEACGYSCWRSKPNFANWRKQPMWQQEFDLLYEALTDDQKTNINELIDLAYDPIYYILTMKKGYYTYDHVVRTMRRGSPNLQKLLTNLQTYLASYASTLSTE